MCFESKTVTIKLATGLLLIGLVGWQSGCGGEPEEDLINHTEQEVNIPSPPHAIGSPHGSNVNFGDCVPFWWEVENRCMFKYTQHTDCPNREVEYCYTIRLRPRGCFDGYQPMAPIECCSFYNCQVCKCKVNRVGPIMAP